jgi:hypothetical protein
MVAMIEIALLIAFALLGLWWFSRTSTFRAHRRSGVDPDRRPQTDRERQKGTGSPGGSPDLPSSRFPRPGS